MRRTMAIFLHGESKRALVSIGKNILYKAASKKQTNKQISKNSLKCNDQKNFTTVGTLEKSLLA